MSDDTGATAPEHGSMRCKVGMHDFHKTTNDEGIAYLVCSRCGKEDYPDGIAGGGIVPY